MRIRSWALCVLPVLAACSSGPQEEPSYRRPTVVAADVKSGGPSIQYGVERTGLEFQIDRGSKVGDELLGGRIVIQRVTDNSSLGALQADFQVKSRTADPVLGLYRVIFYDDKDVPVDPVASVWEPLSIDQAYGTAALHARCAARKAVYFVLEAWQGAAQAKAEKPAEKK
jgi:hypothetical protein